ncbi:hypothetical protein HELRODRAFT_172874 [Helobdella robusta]|uniref:Uncharacterized protein n=1 Tax=Helobdella robusta TaxID=6412 RepID=T1F620_HELRO|nr:hypothetical protein HELRODRAFT_172874 [Helobdella robusta]ESO03851.1 hypothetical protein HELRODRAFT_172874 [Helobdella robusta]
MRILVNQLQQSVAQKFRINIYESVVSVFHCPHSPFCGFACFLQDKSENPVNQHAAVQNDGNAYRDDDDGEDEDYFDREYDEDDDDGDDDDDDLKVGSGDDEVLAADNKTAALRLTELHYKEYKKEEWLHIFLSSFHLSLKWFDDDNDADKVEMSLMTLMVNLL